MWMTSNAFIKGDRDKSIKVDPFADEMKII